MYRELELKGKPKHKPQLQPGSCIKPTQTGCWKQSRKLITFGSPLQTTTLPKPYWSADPQAQLTAGFCLPLNTVGGYNPTTQQIQKVKAEKVCGCGSCYRPPLELCAPAHLQLHFSQSFASSSQPFPLHPLPTLGP